MARNIDHDRAYEATTSNGPSSTHHTLDNPCPQDELALYEGLEQLGTSAGAIQHPAAQFISPHDTASSTPSNELINLSHETFATNDQPHTSLQNEDRNESEPAPHRHTAPRPASSASQSVPATELSMYTANSPSQSLLDARQEALDNLESQRDNPQNAAAGFVQRSRDTHSTELDAYGALSRAGDEPSRAGGSGSSSPHHHSQQTDFAHRASSTVPDASNPPQLWPLGDAVSGGSSAARKNSIVLPRWQPDAEVTYCPICSVQFSFFNRKHHCRKCGRVVCATCSQHRITIPHEFIVHPPQDTTTSTRRPSLSQRDTDAASTSCGGTKVRLCDPCVPDPNPLPPPQIQPAERLRQPERPTYMMSGFGQDQYRITEEALNAFEAMGSQSSRMSPERHRTLSYSTRPIVHRPPFPESRFPPRTTSQHIRNTSYTAPRYTAPPESQPQFQSQSYGAPPPYMPSNASHLPSQPRGGVHNNGLLNPSIRPHQGQVVHSMLNTDSPPPPAPRREVPEEDICPICRGDLRSIAEAERRSRVVAGNFEWSDEETTRVREKHTEDCFNQQASILSGRGRRQQTISEGSPIPGRPGAGSAGMAGAAGPSSQLPRAPRRVYGMFPFDATEKDCVDDAECSICMEDIEPGAKMGRLECFCRFHEVCIRGWWEKKPGMCPVHGHNMEGL